MLKKNTNKTKLIGVKNNMKRSMVIFIVIIIIFLVLLSFTGYKLGKIGYDYRKSPVLENEVKTIMVSNNELLLDKNTKIDIFSNVKFDGEHIIAPMSSGSYKFVVKNTSEQNLSYNIFFTDEMTNPVNMVYKLKIDNVYIRGNEKEYVSLDQLNVDDITVLNGSSNVFTLEWYWADDNLNDTYTGSQKEDQYYTLNVAVELNE